MKTPSIALSAMLLAATTALCASNALARDYLIEIVIFETINGRVDAASGLYYPKVGKSISLNSDTAAQAGFLPVEEGLTLTDNAASIARSSRYRLIRHMAWRQPGLDEDNAVPVRISLGPAAPLFVPEDSRPYESFIPASINATPTNPRQINTSTVSGTIQVRLGRFLHMEVLLAFKDSESGQSFRLAQSRKMRSRELHYIDNPRFGLLTRILPLEDPEKDTEPATDEAAEADSVEIPDENTDLANETAETDTQPAIRAQPSTE